jgi:signal transduction histidine kinase
VARQFNLRLEERVDERTRIARDLHDTLLQSFQGVLLNFSTLKHMLPDKAGDARQLLETFVEQARDAITEARDAVQGLRSSIVSTNDIAQALSTFGNELAANDCGQNPPGFGMQVRGTPRNLVPLVRDEVYRVGTEALRNAFRHAEAKRIEVEVRYDRWELRLRVRDDGKGINETVLRDGAREGHYGLAGMYERAKITGGRLNIWSRLDSGTEAELTIPASIAYQKPAAARRDAVGKETQP